jgi:ribonuclease P protein component
MGGGHTAATVIVDKKVSKLAIVRNLIKRRIRAILRQQGLPEGHLVVRAYQGAASLSHEQISKHLQVCLRAPSR